MATFALLHGAGSDSWYWHLVVPHLRAAGHDVLAPDLPCEDEGATFDDYADVVVQGLDGRDEVVLVAQSLAGFTAPLVADRRPVEMIILVAAMVPLPGEPAGEWWANTGWTPRDPDGEFDPTVEFFHDVSDDVTAEAMARGARDQAGKPFEAPWPLEAWPDVPTRFLLGRQDRFFPAAFLRRVVPERLGLVPDEMDAGHLPALSRPEELANRLLSYWQER